MCKNNSLCPNQDDSCQCKANGSHSAFRCLQTHPQTQGFSFPGQPAQLSDMQLFELLRQQTELVKMIAQQNTQFISALVNLTDRLEHTHDTEASDNEPTIPKGALVEPVHEGYPAIEDLLSVVSDQKRFDYELKLVSEVPNPAYKDRAFPLELELHPLEPGLNLPENPELKVLMFTTENPPKLVEKNTGGDKVMKGSTEMEISGNHITFPKVIVKEVTSHYRNGCTFLAVVAKNVPTVKPLIIEKFVVKARKINGEALVKRVKTEEPEQKPQGGQESSPQDNQS